MRNGMFVPVTRIKSSPDVKSDGKARVGDNKPTLTQRGIDVDAFICDNLIIDFFNGEVQEMKATKE